MRATIEALVDRGQREVQPSVDAPQTALLAPVPLLGHVLVFSLKPLQNPRESLIKLAPLPGNPASVVGIGTPLVLALGATVDGLRPFPVISGLGTSYPSTQAAIWCHSAETTGATCSIARERCTTSWAVRLPIGRRGDHLPLP